MGSKPCLSNGNEVIMYYVFLFIHATSALSPSLWQRIGDSYKNLSLFFKKCLWIWVRLKDSSKFLTTKSRMGHDSTTVPKRLPRIHAAIPSTPRSQSQNMIARELVFSNMRFWFLFIYFSKIKVQMEMGIKLLPFPLLPSSPSNYFPLRLSFNTENKCQHFGCFSHSGKDKSGNGSGLMLPFLLFKFSQTQSSFPPQIHFTPLYDIVMVSCDPQGSELLFLHWDLPKAEGCVDKFNPFKSHIAIFYR